MPKQYEEIRRQIKRKIESGEWPVGYKLPTEMDLCRQFDASRTTVRHALAPLVAEEKLRRVKGTGTFVSSPQLFDRTTLFIQSFSEEIKSRNLTCITEVLEQRTLQVTDEHIIASLNVSRKQTVFKLRRLLYTAELKESGPMVLTTSYFPMEVGEKIQGNDFERVSLYQTCRLNHIHRCRSLKTITATRLSPKDCRLLHAAEEDLFLLVTTKAWNEHNLQVEYCESYYPVDRHVFTLSITSGTV